MNRAHYVLWSSGAYVSCGCSVGKDHHTSETITLVAHGEDFEGCGLDACVIGGFCQARVPCEYAEPGDLA